MSLSATDYVGHRFGTEGLEMCLQLHELDQALGHFFADLDSRGLDYAVVLTADHGEKTFPSVCVKRAIRKPGACPTN